MRPINNPQHSAWLGWFPILFYTTVYVGELHKRAAASLPSTNTNPLLSDAAALEAEANRLGSRALLYSALVALASNMILPFFIAQREGGGSRGRGTTKRVWWKFHMASLWASGHAVFALCMGATLCVVCFLHLPVGQR